MIDGQVHGSEKWLPVINAIAKDGLKSALKLRQEGRQFFPSDDEFPRDYIAGIRLYPFSPQDREGAGYFLRRLYSDAESVFPVLLERLGEKMFSYSSVKVEPDAVIKQECERRAAASFVIVCKRALQDWSSSTSIPSYQFDYVLFPNAIYDQYTNDRFAIPFPSNVRIKVIEDVVKRSIDLKGEMELDFPNYEFALQDILNSGVESIFVHGVRLPLDDEKVLFKKAA